MSHDSCESFGFKCLLVQFECMGTHVEKHRNKEGITYFKNNINQQLRRDGKNTQKNYTKKKKKILMTQTTTWSDHSHRAKHPRKRTQVGLRNHYYERTSGGDVIPVELFRILTDDATKVLHSICQQIWKTQQWPQDGKSSVFIPIPKKGNPK